MSDNLDLLLDIPSKRYRPAVVVIIATIFVVAPVGATLYTGYSVIDGMATQASKAASSRVQEDLDRHKKDEDKTLVEVLIKLDAIQRDENAINIHLGHLDQWVTDQSGDSTYAGRKH